MAFDEVFMHFQTPSGVRGSNVVTVAHGHRIDKDILLKKGYVLDDAALAGGGNGQQRFVAIDAGL